MFWIGLTALSLHKFFIFYASCKLVVIPKAQLSSLFFFFFGKNTLYECFVLPIASYWEAIMSVDVTFNGIKIDW